MSELWLCFPCCVTEQPQPVKSNALQVLVVSCLDVGFLSDIAIQRLMFSLYSAEEAKNRPFHDWRTYEF